MNTIKSNTEPKLLGNIIKDVTTGKLPMPKLPPIAPIAPISTPESSQKMTQKDLTEWLYAINQALRAVGRLPMTDNRIKGFTKYLFAKGYTFDHADCAEQFLIFGKRSNYTTQDVLPEYFYPTAADMQQFKVEFIPIALADAKLREAVRQEKIIQKEMTANHERDKRTLRDEIAWLRTPGRVSVENSPETKLLFQNINKDLENRLQEKKFEKLAKAQEFELKDLRKQRLKLMLQLHEYGEEIEFTDEEVAMLHSMGLIEINQLETE